MAARRKRRNRSRKRERQPARGGLVQQASGAEAPAQNGNGNGNAANGKPGPDEQRAYEQFVGNAMQIVYSEQAMPRILQAISAARQQNPVEGLANAVAMVMTRLEDSAAQSGAEVSQDVRAAAAKEIVEQIAELAGPKGADIHEFTQEELGEAYWAASNLYNNARAAQQQGQQGQQGQQQRGRQQGQRQPTPGPRGQRRPDAQQAGGGSGGLLNARPRQPAGGGAY